MLDCVGVFVKRGRERAYACRATPEALKQGLKVPAVVFGEPIRVYAKELAGFVAESGREWALIYFREISHSLEKRVCDAGGRAAPRSDALDHFWGGHKLKALCRTADNVAQVFIVVKIELVHAAAKT